MNARISFLLPLLGALLFLPACRNHFADGLIFESLTCNSYHEPVGLEDPAPAFSWVLSTPGKKQYQSAFQVLVATSPQKLHENEADMWNSGKVTSGRSVFRKYEGKALRPMTRYWWKVRIWNGEGRSSGWSEPTFFQTGLMDETHWEGARWMQLPRDTRSSEYRFREIQNQRMEEPVLKKSFPAGYFRKEFDRSKTVEEAFLYICALGYYEAFLNGKKIGDHVLDPSPTSYDQRALYVVHDVSDLLAPGRNTLGVVLGNSFYGQNMAFYPAGLSYGKPSVKVLLNIRYADGTSENILSGPSWKAGTGPIVFDNVYAGETYDARYAIPHWNTSGFDDADWVQPALPDPAVGKLSPQLMPPVRKVRHLFPRGIFKSGSGNWIIDFGENISGWVKIHVSEKRGQKIKILYAEALTKKGDAVHPGSAGKFATGVHQEDIYICKGGGPESWEPRFTYHGFQYAEISGLTEKPTKESIQAVWVHNDVEETGSFHCSSKLLNQMVDVSKRTVLDNLHGFPEDCPHREKCGWLGDAQVNAEFSLYQFDMAGVYHKYMEDIRSQLTPVKGKSGQGSTFRVPTMIAPGKRKAGIAQLDWGIAAIYIPWYHYLHKRDASLLRVHYEAMKALVNYYLTFKNEQGIIENGLGDWCPPRWDRQDNPGAMECHPYVSASAYFFDILRIMHHIGQRMNDPEYAAFCRSESDKLKTAFNHQFLQDMGGEGRQWYGSQTGTVMALQFGMVPDSVRNNVVEGLIYDITENKKGHHSTGIHGNRYIYSVLNDLGEEALSAEILTTRGFPSQAYILGCGFSTWPERQWAWDRRDEWDRSLNHPMHSGFAAFFYESVGGIQPMAGDPGFKTFRIEPHFLPGVDFAKTTLQSPYGEIVTHWRKDKEKIHLDVTIPFNTEAIVKLPVKAGASVILHGLKDEGDRSVPGGEGIPLGSGTYSLSFIRLNSLF